MKNHINANSPEQTGGEQNLSSQQWERARDILRPVSPASVVLVYAQECVLRTVEAKMSDSEMGRYCRLMLQLCPEERLLVAQNGLAKKTSMTPVMFQAAQLRARLLFYEKPRHGYPWRKA